MGNSLAQRASVEEDHRVDHADQCPSCAVNRVDRLNAMAIDLTMAKAKLGACIRTGIGDDALKEYGDKGLVGKVCTGEKAPDYLARIYLDKAARRRFALALLNDDTDVIVTTVVTVPTKVR